jgi:hypothetical protein
MMTIRLATIEIEKVNHILCEASGKLCLTNAATGDTKIIPYSSPRDILKELKSRPYKIIKKGFEALALDCWEE